MTQKGELSKAEHIDWKYVPLVIQKLELDKQYKICLIVAFGCFFGLRLKNILNLRWEDVLYKTSFELKEKNKQRTIFIIDDIKHLIDRVYVKLGSPEPEQLVFLNNAKTQALSSQYVNKQIKVLFAKYEIPYSCLSSDSFLKTFCVKYLESQDFSLEAKKWISRILGHASWTITARFLGCEEDMDEKQNYQTFSMST